MKKTLPFNKNAYKVILDSKLAKPPTMMDRIMQVAQTVQYGAAGTTARN